MNAGLMSKGILADNGLVILHRESRHRRHQLGSPGQQFGVDASAVGKHVITGADGHHHLFQRCVACALAQAVDRAFDLPRTTANSGQRIGHRHAQIIMAVGRENRLVRIWNGFDYPFEHVGDFERRGIADRVGNIDRGGNRH